MVFMETTTEFSITVRFAPSPWSPGPNQYAGTCKCGTFVPAGDGHYDGSVWCSTPGEVIFDGSPRGQHRQRACEAQALDPETAKRHAAHERKVAREAEQRTPTPAEVAATKARAAQNAEWAQQGLTRCRRCGGAGGFAHWPGFTCFECEGTGSVEAK